MMHVVVLFVLVEDSSTAVKTEAPPQKPASGSPSTAPPTSIAQSPISEDKMTDVLSSNQTTLEGNSPSVVAGWLAIEFNAFIMFLHEPFEGHFMYL